MPPARVSRKWGAVNNTGLNQAGVNQAESASVIATQSARVKHIVTACLDMVEDLVYIGLGILLAVAAIWLLGSAAWTFIHELATNTLSGQLIGLLDQILLVLLILELLYTVQVSFREHTLVTEPFLVIAFIATVRKLLVLTAQIPQSEETDAMFHRTVLELSMLSGMVVILVGSLILLRRYGAENKNKPHAG